MKTLTLFISLIFCLFPFSQMQAQKDTSLVNQQVRIKMFGGKKYHGLLLQKDDSIAVLKSANGEFSLNSANIRRIKKFAFGEKFWYSNPHNTHYFVAPSAIPMQKGKVYYHNYLLSTNAVQVGISKYVSIGTAFEVISFLEYPPETIWSLNIKVGLQPAKMLHLGGGAVWVRAHTFTTYFVATLGTKESNASIGINYNHKDTDYIGDKGFSASLSAVHRLSNKISLMIENNVYINRGLPVSIGIYGIQLHFKRNNFRFAYSFSNPENDFSDNRLLPFVGYSRML